MQRLLVQLVRGPVRLLSAGADTAVSLHGCAKRLTAAGYATIDGVWVRITPEGLKAVDDALKRRTAPSKWDGPSRVASEPPKGKRRG